MRLKHVSRDSFVVDIDIKWFVAGGKCGYFLSKHTEAYKKLFCISNASFCGEYFFVHPPPLGPSGGEKCMFFLFFKRVSRYAFVLCCESMLFEIRVLSQTFFSLSLLFFHFSLLFMSFFCDANKRKRWEFCWCVFLKNYFFVQF